MGSIQAPLEPAHRVPRNVIPWSPPSPTSLGPCPICIPPVRLPPRHRSPHLPNEHFPAPGLSARPGRRVRVFPSQGRRGPGAFGLWHHLRPLPLKNSGLIDCRHLISKTRPAAGCRNRVQSPPRCHVSHDLEIRRSRARSPRPILEAAGFLSASATECW